MTRRVYLGLWALLLVTTGDVCAYETLQKRLGIPPAVASVTDASSPDMSEIPRYILIQDLHEHPESQSAIAAIALYGRRAWNVRTLFIEGAQGPVTPAPEPAEHTGAERAVLMDREKNLSLFGMENWDIYRENLAAYDRTRRLQSAALEELHTIRLLGRTLDVAPDTHRWSQIEKMVRLELKPDDYAQMISGPLAPLASPALAEALESAAMFYRLADQRSAIFLENARIVAGEGPRILVVGGFHTPAMAEALRKQKESFVVLTPRITRSGDESRYARRMQESISALRLNAASH